jgi:metallo-beta-lactamase family protein
MRLQFLGATQNVTGSRFLLETPGARVLVDCGLYQERDLRYRNWDPFPVPPASLTAVLLTHAHLDHCGYLPRLVRDGFRGPVHATAASGEIARILLEDAARLQEEDAAFKIRRHERERRRGPRPVVPLYTQADAEACCKHLAPVAYREPVPVAEGVTATFHDAGHILGSASVQVRFRAGRDERSIVFSGDVGRWNRPILEDPEPCPAADYVVVESTYGDRLHETAEDIAARLAAIITSTRARGGNVLVPSFAIERAQEVLYHLNELLQADRIPHLTVFVDSPMAATITELYEQHPELMDEEMRAMLQARHSPFRFPGLTMVRSVEESKGINHIQGTVVIIAGSGMCTGGRIKHHLVNNISRRESTVLFVGYQAAGTLGRLILDGVPEVRILGETRAVRARIEQIHGFSAHADRDELLRWLGSPRPHPSRRVFVTHGEPAAAHSFAEQLERQTRWPTAVPKYGEDVVLA